MQNQVDCKLTSHFMLPVANKESKHPGNVPGKYYVDDQCIDCDLCRGICPSCFGRDEDSGRSVIIKQPDNDEEDLCAEAMEGCPVGAIGDDGDSV